MIELIACIFIFLGSFITLVAALGIVRFPDTITRMAAASKAITLGGVLAGHGALLHPDLRYVWPQSLFFILFLFIATPVAGHLLARAGILRGMPLSSNTQRNDATEWVQQEQNKSE